MGNIEDGFEVRGPGDPVLGGEQSPLDHGVLGVGKVDLDRGYLYQVALGLLIKVGQTKLRQRFTKYISDWEIIIFKN